jgi:hypothetical protein
MSNQDTVKTTQAGLDVDTNGQPVLYSQDGTILQQFPNSTVTGLQVVKLAIPVQVALTGVLSGGAMLNPFGYDVIIEQATLRITTASTGASTMDIGVAADAVTSNDGLFDGMSGAATGLFTNTEDPGTNGEQTIVWGSTQYITVAEASGDVAGIIGSLYVTCYRA